MLTKTKLRICNWVLAVLVIGVFASSVQMTVFHIKHVAGPTFECFMWIHVALTLMMCGMTFYHLWLHFGRNNWIARIKNLPRSGTKFLIVLAALMTCTGVASTVMLLMHGMDHTPVGAIHGKVATVFLVMALVHLVQRRGYYFR